MHGYTWPINCTRTRISHTGFGSGSGRGVAAGETYNEKVDVFSYAMCLVEVADRQLPWAGCCPTSAIPLKVSQGEKPRAQLARIQEKGSPLAELIERCLVRDSSTRERASMRVCGESDCED